MKRINANKPWKQADFNFVIDSYRVGEKATKTAKILARTPKAVQVVYYAYKHYLKFEKFPWKKANHRLIEKYIVDYFNNLEQRKPEKAMEKAEVDTTQSVESVTMEIEKTMDQLFAAIKVYVNVASQQRYGELIHKISDQKQIITSLEKKLEQKKEVESNHKWTDRLLKF